MAVLDVSLFNNIPSFFVYERHTTVYHPGIEIARNNDFLSAVPDLVLISRESIIRR